MRAEPWLDEIGHGTKLAISFGCDYCATTRRKRAIAYWPIAGIVGLRANVCFLVLKRAKAMIFRFQFWFAAVGAADAARRPAEGAGDESLAVALDGRAVCHQQLLRKPFENAPQRGSGRASLDEGIAEFSRHRGLFADREVHVRQDPGASRRTSPAATACSIRMLWGLPAPIRLPT
jgi:hypothetical protein